MEQTSIKKETSIDWLMEQLYKKGFIKEVDGNEPINLMNQAKEREVKQSQDYAAFCINCDRKNYPIVDFESYLKLKDNGKDNI